jgi:DNA-directed RNA polymerase specialized sigma24 family protein
VSSPAQHVFLTLLDADPAEAEQKYRTLRSKLVFYFRHNGCSDPEELADETIQRAMNRLASGVEAYSGVSAYCFGVARFVLQEDRRLPRGQELPAELPNPHPAPRELNRSEQALLVKQSLQKLPASDRELFTKYYLDDREELARSENMTANALRIRVFRIRQRLQDSLQLSGTVSGESETL